MTARRVDGAPLVEPRQVVPDVPDEIVAVAGYGLGPATRAARPLPRAPLDHDRWHRFSPLVLEHRLSGLLARAVAEGAFPVTDEQARAVVANHRAAVGVCLRLDRDLLALADALDRAGVRFVVLKGVGSALTLYDDPAERLYGDVDLLVAGADFDRAAAVVTAMGGARHRPDPQEGFVARFGKSATFSLDGVWEVDLHRTFHLGPFGLAAGRHDLFAEPAARVVVGGRPIPVPGPPTALIAASFHSVLPADSHRIVPLRDVAELLRPGRVDAARAVALAVEWQAAVVLAAAVEVATHLFALPRWSPLQSWAAGYEPTGRERRWLSRHHDERPAAYLLRTVDEVQALGPPSVGAAYVWASLRTAAEDDEPWPHRAARLARVIRPRP
ncbi:MAG: nucleotidyltransferase family protein [Acidimicrobiales bacterium]